MGVMDFNFNEITQKHRYFHHLDYWTEVRYQDLENLLKGNLGITRRKGPAGTMKVG